MLWDTVTGPQPSSCSISTHQSSRAEVMVHSCLRDQSGAVSPPSLNLSSCYTAMPDDNLLHVDGQAGVDPETMPDNTAAFPPLVADDTRAAGNPIMKPNKRTSSQRRMLQLQHSPFWAQSKDYALLLRKNTQP